MLFSLILLSIVSFLIYTLFLKKPKNYWKEHGVKEVPHSNLLNHIQVFIGKKTLADLDQDVYHALPANEKFCGFVQMGNPFLLVKDLDVAKKILIKDFDHFVDRRPFGSSKTQPIMEKMVANLQGEEWKGVRSSLSPTFTTGKIRRMMGYFNECSQEWESHFREEIQRNGGSIEFNVTRETVNYTVDIIASAVFGMSAGVIKNPESTFSVMVQKLSKIDMKQLIKFGMAMNFPKLTNILGIKLFHQEGLDFFETILNQGMKRRMQGVEKRNDFLQLVAEARKGDLKALGSDELSAFEKEAMIDDNEVQKKNWLNDDVVANAQLIQFFFAGFSTTSNFIGFMMYCLALYPDCQEKLRQEVDKELFKDGSNDVDYDILNRLEYMEMCICEALRKFPPLGRIERKCTKDYVDKENNFSVPKGAYVGIPVQAIHNDPKFYEKPDQFYPEHFTQENKAKRNPYAYLPFGTGPRNCIGMRFALVESKAAVAHLVHNFQISPAKSTPIPFKVRPIGFGVQLPDDLELKLSLIKK